MYSGPAYGLYLSPNPFTAAPPGSLAVADDVYFAAPGVLEPRRGFDFMGASRSTSEFGTTGSLADAIVYYGTSILLAYDLTTVALRPVGGPFTDFSGVYIPNGPNRMRFEGAARSMFFNPIDGVRMYDGSGEPSFAGSPAGLSITAANASANGWQLPNTAVAYRHTICRKDAFGRVIEGAPSGRTVLRNYIVSTFGSSGVTRSGGNTVHVTTDLPHGLTTGDIVTLTPGEADFPAGSYTITVDNVVQFHYTNVGANVSATVTLIWNITRSASLTLWLPGEGHSGANFPGVPTTADFLRVYRSEMTLTAAVTPDDELFQCYETPYLTAADIAAGFIAFDDIAPESSLEVPLYTNPNTGDGSLAANFQPPLAQDITYWQNQMWFLNTTGRHAVEFALLGTGAPDGLQIGDTITIAFASAGPELVYTAAAASAGTDFEVSLWSDPGFNVQQTAQALVQAINADTGNENIVATYISSEDGLPGKIRLEALLFSDDVEMTVFSSRATAWTPQLPTFITPLWPAPKSTNSRHAARLCWSKVGQPEAVPLTNYEQIDADNHAGLRMMALKYRLIVFKDDGIYFVPDTLPVSYQKLSDAVLLCPDSVARTGNVVHALTDMGICEISDSGITFISIPIDEALFDLEGSDHLATLKTRTLGLGYRSQKQYLLWLLDPQPPDPTGPDLPNDNAQAFVHSTLGGGGFTRYRFGARAAVINPNADTIVLAPTDDNALWEERKARTLEDFADVALQVTVSNIVGDQVTLSAESEAEAGDVLIWEGGQYLILAVDGVTLTTLGEPPFHGTDDTEIATAIETQVVFNDLTDGDPAQMKLAQQCSFIFKADSVRTTTTEFASEIHPENVEVEKEQLGWGEFEWGSTPWGGPARTMLRVQPVPSDVANCCQLSVGFSTRQAFAKYGFMGIDVVSTDDTSANHGD